MDIAYLGIVIFLFILAILDLMVGVSNDAVNFLGSAVGSKAAPIKYILIVAAIGVFIGAASSNGMMDIARHGIFLPENYSFREIMTILLAVMVSDVILLDIFNNLGLPTSTTVSMVFELFGASCIVASIKLLGSNSDLSFYDLINTGKALAVIISIFVSVAVAFFFGTIVQWLSRLVFTFNYKKNITKKIGIFGGIAATSIVYFMLIKGLKQAAFMTTEAKGWISDNVLIIVAICFVFFTILMQVLHYFKVNVLKVIVMLGTFALAMAFAGNDLVNFIGVTLAGYSSFIDFTQNAGGASPDEFLMTSLNGPSSTPVYFLLIAGLIMVLTLIFSNKSKKVLQTSIDLSRQNEGEEIFGTSRFARFLVRRSSSTANFILKITPSGVINWVDKRFTRPQEQEQDSAFDLVRAAINLVLSGLLIAVGTSLKLPLSTTYVAFMVAMGTSLADRAWGRESAVYRVTGVISVIGGWFITAGAAFAISAISVLIMYFGGMVAMVLMIVLTIVILIRSQIKYSKKISQPHSDSLMDTIMTSNDELVVWNAVKEHSGATVSTAIENAANIYIDMYMAFINDKRRDLISTQNKLIDCKADFKYTRIKELRGLMRVNKSIVYEKSTWYYLAINYTQQIYYTLLRISTPMCEHSNNNFSPLPDNYVKEFSSYCFGICQSLNDISNIIKTGDFSNSLEISQRAKDLKHSLSLLRRTQIERMKEKPMASKIDFIYLNIIQESHEILSQVRNVLRGSEKFFNENATQTIIEEIPDLDAPSLMIEAE